MPRIFLRFGFYLLRYFFQLFNYDLSVGRIPSRKGVNLNVACGSYEIKGFTSLDFFSI